MFNPETHEIDLKTSLKLSLKICLWMQAEHIRQKKRIKNRKRKESYDIRLKQRYPKWADRQQVNLVYKFCPKDMTVDHIIPLGGNTISGLHVHTNFQYLDKKGNSYKSNEFIPYREVRGVIAEYYPPTIDNVTEAAIL